MIEQVTWNIGGMTSANYQTAKASDWYTAERGEETYGGQLSTWDGYIGLMYLSDYGYATSGGGSTDRDACLAGALYNWYASPYQTDCAKSNNWLYYSTSQWTIAPYSSYSDAVFLVTSNGGLINDNASDTYAVRPSLYLKSNVRVLSGDGNPDGEGPYILMA